MTERFMLTSSDGLSLEAELDAVKEPEAVLVFCHPHPRMGGTMNAPLLLAVKDELVDRDWAVVRFNFRGIGASEGPSEMGLHEVADAQGALAFARDRFGGVPVGLAGWSFGAAVAIRTLAEDHDVAAGVLIAPAIEERPGVTAGAPSPSHIEITAPTLLICGTNDHLVDAESCRQWAEPLPTVEFMAMEGANHFFWGRYEALAAAAAGFLEAAI